jgi:polysaccharide pyruvyl transferase WcaK-like protein
MLKCGSIDSMTQHTYLIASANSYGNVGDDVCGYSAEYLIKTVDSQARTIITQPPFNEALAEQADTFIIGGGGILYDGDFQNVENYMQYVEYAQAHNHKSAVLGVGVQGIHSQKGRSRYRETLSGTQVVTVRSPIDEKQLKDIGLQNVVTTQDLGFVTDEWVKQPRWLTRQRIKYGMKKNAKPNLGIAFVDLVKIKGDHFDAASKNFVDAFENNLNRLAEEFNVYLLVHSRDDAEYYARLKSNHKGVTVVPYRDIRDMPRMWAYYEQMDLLLGSRFHSIILACLAGVPVVAIGSEGAKQNRLANYDMPSLKSQRILLSDTDAIRDLFENLQQNFDQGRYRPVDSEDVQRAKQRAHENAALLKSVL